MPVLDATALIDQRVQAIRSMHERAGTMRAELDLSGGIDSATMLGLLVRALGPEQVYTVYSSINSSDESRSRARLAAEAAGVKLLEVDLSDVYERMLDATKQAFATALGEARRAEADAQAERDPAIHGSLRSCLRAPLGRFLNRYAGGGLRHGTGNEDEDRWLRFYQKGGDGEVDSNPLAMLSKGEVYQLARALDVPGELIEAKPTPDLWGIGEGHNDEDELQRLTGVAWTYSRVDPATGQYIQVGSIERMSRALDLPLPGGHKLETELFAGQITEGQMTGLAEVASPLFPGRDVEQVTALLRSARRMEAATRHKLNPNCPTLGNREQLVHLGILSDDLPGEP